MIAVPAVPGGDSNTATATSCNESHGPTRVLRMTDGSALFRQAAQYQQAGALFEAEQLYKKVLKANPGHPDAVFNLALLQAGSGKVRSAKSLVLELLRTRPDDGDAHYLAAKLFEQERELKKAAYHFARATALLPDRLEAHLDLLRVYGVLHRIDDARQVAQNALRRFPDNPEIPLQLGVALATQGLREEARSLFEAVLQVIPEHPLALFNLARTYAAERHNGTALDLYRRARAADPESKLPPAITADLELNLGYVEEAIRHYEDWLNDHPTHADVLSGRLLATQYLPDISPEKLLELHKDWDTRFGRTASLNRSRRAPDSAALGRRLRVGLVSGDLGEHPVGFLVIRACEEIDPSEMELFAYSDDNRDDAVARRFRHCIRHWRDIAGRPDEHVAATITKDRIDILIDLAGHTSPSRLPVFALRPAPIQITWAGYVGTTGLSAMNALIADRFQVTPGTEAHYTETIVRMPDSYVCFDPPVDPPSVAPLPAGAAGPLTFAAFHAPAKINSDVVALWARVLAMEAGSRILFVYAGYDMAEVQERIRGWFAVGGISSERLCFNGRLSRRELLQRYNEADLALDTFPYSGGITTCEALWMGVPVITLPGRTFAGRHSLSHLSVVGLTETIARDADDYVQIVRRLGADRLHLRELRSGLRGRVLASPLCDAPRFARHLQAALRQLWRDWCRGSSNVSPASAF